MPGTNFYFDLAKNNDNAIEVTPGATGNTTMIRYECLVDITIPSLTYTQF